MPTKKPRIQSILEIDIYEKFKYICELEMRSESQMTNYIITQFINNYEKQHGTINVKNINVIDNNGGTINM